MASDLRATPTGLPLERELPTWPCLPLAVVLAPLTLGTSLILMPLLWCALLERSERQRRAPG